MVYSKTGLKYKRRVNQKTNYAKRFSLLKSKLPRIVFRKTNLYGYLQYVVHDPKGDNSKLSVSSKRLKTLGWTKGTSSIPALYLAGYLFGHEVKAKKLSNKVVFDIGLHSARKGGRVFAAIAGAKDAGLEFEFDSSVAPSEDRIKGKHISTEKLFEKVKESIDKM